MRRPIVLLKKEGFILVALCFYILDFLMAFLRDSTVLRSLVAYFLFLVLYFDHGEPKKSVLFRSSVFGATFFLVLLQNSYFYGRFGVDFIIFLPIFLFALLFKKIVHSFWYPLIYLFLIIFYFFFEFFLIKKAILRCNCAPESTFYEILSTIIVGILILFGMRGNRFFRMN